MTLDEMYTEAVHNTRDNSGEIRYKGYTDGNALSLYVYEKYGVNAADNYHAKNALVDALNS